MGTALILDAGVFIGLDNPSQRRVILALMQKMQKEDIVPVTNSAALSQAWREPARQVPMTLLLKAVKVYPLGDPKVIGRRCAITQTSDIVDASLAVLSDQLGMPILTTDPDDMRQLNASFISL